LGVSSATVNDVVLGAELPLMMLLYLAVMCHCCVGHKPASVDDAVLWTQMCHSSGCRIGTELPVVMLLMGTELLVLMLLCGHNVV